MATTTKKPAAKPAAKKTTAAKPAVKKTTTTAKPAAAKSGELSVNGEEKEPIEPIILADRTLLPLRAISELLQKQVFWLKE